MLEIDLRRALSIGRIDQFSIGDDISKVRRILSKTIDESKFWNDSLIEGATFGQGWYEFQDIEIHF